MHTTNQEATLLVQRINSPFPSVTKKAFGQLKSWAAFSSEAQAFIETNENAANLLAGIAEGSPYLWQLVTSHPERTLRFLQTTPETERHAILERAKNARNLPTIEALMRALRIAKQECALLAAFADIGNVWDVPEVTAFLSDLADTALCSATSFLLREAAEQGKYILKNSDDFEEGCGFFVLAMGKHGARELNYSSDIDLIALFDPQRIALRENIEAVPFFVRLVQKLVKIIQERTPDGYVFRVDLRLRPDPGSTSVALSTDAALSYYEDVGQNWERAAMLKARVCAGDKVAGESFLRELNPFIWRKHLDYASIADIHAMKRQIHAHRGHGQIAADGHNLKLGRGGIREIEFFVQTQQLVAGGRSFPLRVKGTEAGLAALTEEKWITAKVRDELIKAYRFLRRSEHRLQMMHDEQTHTLPLGAREMEAYAKFSGFKNRGAFAETLLKFLDTVQKHYAHLFEDAPPLSAKFGSMVFTGDTHDPETLFTLKKMGFSDPEQVSECVRGWHYGRYNAMRSSRARELLTELVPYLLDAFSQTTCPSSAFLAFDTMLKRMPAGVEFLAILRSNPSFMAFLADALGTAPRLRDKVIKRPHILDAILEPAFFATLPDASVLKQRLERTLKEGQGFEDKLDRARIFGQEQMALIEMRVLSGALPDERAAEAFSTLGDVLIEALLICAQEDIEQTHGVIEGGRVAVLGMGKLGSREMTAASDLDLILLYDHHEDAVESNGRRPLSPSQYYTRLTQRLLAALSAPTGEGILYEVDFRLRPSGRSGPLATHISAFETYQKEEAWTWETMALTRARVIAGETIFAKEIAEVIKQCIVLPRPIKKVTADILEMRKILAKERGDKDPFDLKYSRGGIIDLEFIAQFLQLKHANKKGSLLKRHTLHVLEESHRLKIISDESYSSLKEGYILLNMLMHRLKICITDNNSKEIPQQTQNVLCRIAGYADFKQLTVSLKLKQEEIRGEFSRIILENNG